MTFLMFIADLSRFGPTYPEEALKKIIRRTPEPNKIRVLQIMLVEF